MKVIVLQGVGYGFLVLGVVGLVLPFLQGILFILIGLIILAKHAGWAQRLLHRVRNYHPEAGRRIREAEIRSKYWWRKTSRRMLRSIRW